MFLSGTDIQLGRGEPIKDTARVMGRMIHGAIIRTFAQQDVVEFAQYSGIPTINALTDDEHPCQILADLQTINERLGTWKGKRVCFLGDGDCNVARSWIWASARLGFELVIGAPKERAMQEVFGKEMAMLSPEARELVEKMMTYMEKKCVAIPIKAAKQIVLNAAAKVRLWKGRGTHLGRSGGLHAP